MHDKHEPDPQFVENLEWQLGSELRRRDRAGTTQHRSLRVMKIAALMLGSVVLGAAAMGASQQLGETWRRELLEARLEVQLQLAQQRVQTQLLALGLTREQVELGLQTDNDLIYFELKIAQAETDANIVQLELEELQQSGREPLGELSSPLVNGRDFVSERIEARMDLARHHLMVVRSEQQRMRERADLGVMSESDVAGQRIVTIEAEQQIMTLQEQLDVRRSYLDSEITAVEAELRLLELEAQSRVVVLDQQRQYFQQMLNGFQDAIDAGSMHPAAEVQMRTQVDEMEAQLQLAQAELDIVQRELERRRENR
jgi:outer membrane protein TolC